MENTSNSSDSTQTGTLKKVFVARQPVFDREKNIFAYELLFRSGFDNFYDSVDGDFATSKIIDNTFSLLGINTITNGKLACINFTRTLLVNQTPTLLPKQFTGIEILENVEPDEEVLAACQNLKTLGYTIILDDFIFHEKYRPLIEFADIIKIDFLSTKTPEREAVFGKVKNKNVKFLAEKVETQEDFQEAFDLGYAYFQGYFFSKPVVISGRDIPSQKLTHLQILKEIHRNDVEFADLEKIIKHDVSLTYKLLRLINSAAFGLRSEIRSVKQALVLLGMKEIKKWVSLIQIASLAHDKPVALVINSIVRAKFCELIAPMVGLKDNSSDLFLMGMFSMIDALCDQPLDQILDELPLSEDIKIALLGQENSFRDIYELILSYEKGEWDKHATYSTKLAVEEEKVPLLFHQSLSWANEIPVS